MTAIASIVHALANWTLLLTIIGGFLDSLTYPQEQSRIQNLLQEWWKRFQPLTWSSFGKAEARTAMEYFDRYFGARLLSLQRLQTSVLIVFSGFIVAAVWAFANISYRPVPGMIAIFLHYEEISPLAIRSALVRIAVVILLVPISLSLTRYLCSLVIDKFPDQFSSVGFALLLACHVALLIWWRPIVDLVSELPAYFSITGGHILVQSPPNAPVTPQTLQQRDLVTWGNCDHYFHAYCLPLRFSLAFRTYVDYAANGLRIAFGVAFFGSFLVGTIGKQLVARILYKLAQRKKFVFTAALGGLSVVVIALDRALQAGLRP